ncbi:MAG: DUF1150 family protein [Pseudomonadota bacterium]
MTTKQATKQTKGQTTGQPIVYVREAMRDNLPDELKTAPGPFYSLHDEAGRVLALAPNRSVAFALARQNDMEPRSVH